MVAVDTVGEESQTDNLEEEVADGQVDETEEEEHTGAEVEGQHSVPGHNASRLAEQFLAYLFGHISCAAVLFAQEFQEFLELGRALLLLAGVVNVGLEEEPPNDPL